jgi:hypothetical protein
MPVPFLFSCVWPYQTAAIAVLVYLQFTWGSAPPPYSGAPGAPPSLLHVLFFSCLFIIQVFFLFFFLQDSSQSDQGAMLIFSGVAVGELHATYCSLWVCQGG